jgi:hypothetical protein
MRWKDRICRFWIFPAGRQLRLAGRRRLPEGKMQLAGSKDGGWLYTDRHPGAKMGIPVYTEWDLEVQNGNSG